LTNESKEPIQKEEKANTHLTHVKTSKQITEKPTPSVSEIIKHNRAKESRGKYITNLLYIKEGSKNVIFYFR